MSGSDLFFKLLHSHVVDSDDSSNSYDSTDSNDSSSSSDDQDGYNSSNGCLYNPRTFDFSKATFIGSEPIIHEKPKVKKTLKVSQPKKSLVFNQGFNTFPQIQSVNLPKPLVIQPDIPPQDPRTPGEDDEMYNKRVDLYNKIALTKFAKYANTYSIAMVNRIMKQVNYTPDVESAMKQVANEIGILDWETK